MNLTDYINALGGAAAQVVAATNGTAPVSTPPPAAATPAKTGLPKWAIWGGVGLLVAVGGVLLLRRRR